MNSWYALFVKTGYEETVQKYLQYHFEYDVNSIIPKRKVLEKKNGKSYPALKSLFPGYVLLNAELNVNKYYVLKHIPKLIKLLGSGTNYAPIGDDEIETILSLTGSEGIIDYSKIYIENSTVYVKEGPLKGFEGMIKKIDKHARRAKLQISFMGEPRLIDVGIEILHTMDK